MDITKEEQSAINVLKRLATRWPKTLWLYSASGTLCVMRINKHGKEAMTPNGYVDPAYRIDSIDIPNDGGDW